MKKMINKVKAINKVINNSKDEYPEVEKIDLKNYPIQEVNSQALKVTKYFKNQKPYTGTDLYTDDLFPPTFASIMGLDSEGNPKDKDYPYAQLDYTEEVVVWKRASEIFKGKYAVFEGNISADDIIQGGVSDCYFVSTLASLCNYPQLIVQNFRHLKVQENGYYEICLRIDGEWKVVIVDDYFPMCDDELLASKPFGNEIWVMLLEKAWAKVNGGYNYINLGYGREAFAALTNFSLQSFEIDVLPTADAPYEYYQHYLKNYFNDKETQITTSEELLEAIWKKMKFLNDNKSIITCISRTPTDGEFEALKPNGIIISHEYSFLNLYEGNVNGHTVRLVKLRNPHGKYEFNGKWSDKSEEWNEETRKIFNNFADQDDGSFFMEFKEFVENFSWIDSCTPLDPLCSKTLVINKDYPNKVKAYDLILSKPSIVNLSLIGKNKRFHKSVPHKRNQNVDILLVKKNKVGGETDELKLIFKKTEHDSNNNTYSFNLEAGRYLIFLRFDMKDFVYDKIRKINFNISSNNNFFFDYNNDDTSGKIFEEINYDKNFAIDKSSEYGAIYFKSHKVINNSNFDYVFRNLQVDLSKIIENVDHFKAMFEYHESLNPKPYYIIKTRLPVQIHEEYKDNKKTIGRGFFDDKFIESEIYMVGANYVWSGRGRVFDYSTMKDYVIDFLCTYFVNRVQQGLVIQYVNDVFTEYTAYDYVINGEGRAYLRDGRVKKIIWENSVIKSEEFVEEEHKYKEEFEGLFKDIPVYEEETDTTDDHTNHDEALNVEQIVENSDRPSD